LITDNEAVQLVDNYFAEETKALRGDLIHKNTELLEERKRHAMTKSELDIAKKTIKKLRSGNYHQRA